jgi:hypothetical protein
MNSQLFMGVHREHSRSTQGARRRYVWATSLRTIRECIYETEHFSQRLSAGLMALSLILSRLFVSFQRPDVERSQ